MGSGYFLSCVLTLFRTKMCTGVHLRRQQLREMLPVSLPTVRRGTVVAGALCALQLLWARHCWYRWTGRRLCYERRNSAITARHGKSISSDYYYFLLLLLFFITPYTAARKHRLLTTKNASRLHLKYKNVNTSVKAPSCARWATPHTQQSHGGRPRAQHRHTPDAPRPHQERSTAPTHQQWLKWGGSSPLLRLWRSLPPPLLESEPSLPTAGPKLLNSTKNHNVRCRINKF